MIIWQALVTKSFLNFICFWSLLYYFIEWSWDYFFICWYLNITVRENGTFQFILFFLSWDSTLSMSTVVFRLLWCLFLVFYYRKLNMNWRNTSHTSLIKSKIKIFQIGFGSYYVISSSISDRILLNIYTKDKNELKQDTFCQIYFTILLSEWKWELKTISSLNFWFWGLWSLLIMIE